MLIWPWKSTLLLAWEAKLGSFSGIFFLVLTVAHALHVPVVLLTLHWISLFFFSTFFWFLYKKSLINVNYWMTYVLEYFIVLLIRYNKNTQLQCQELSVALLVSTIKLLRYAWQYSLLKHDDDLILLCQYCSFIIYIYIFEYIIYWYFPCLIREMQVPHHKRMALMIHSLSLILKRQYRNWFSNLLTKELMTICLSFLRRWEVYWSLIYDLTLRLIGFSCELILSFNLSICLAVAKALRRVAEGKATAQAEAAEWKRKYELERERNIQFEHKGFWVISSLLICLMCFCIASVLFSVD